MKNERVNSAVNGPLGTAGSRFPTKHRLLPASQKRFAALAGSFLWPL